MLFLSVPSVFAAAVVVVVVVVVVVWFVSCGFAYMRECRRTNACMAYVFALRETDRETDAQTDEQRQTLFILKNNNFFDQIKYNLVNYWFDNNDTR